MILDKRVVMDIDGVVADYERAFCLTFGFDKREFFSLEKRYPNKLIEIRQFGNSPSTYRNLEVLQLGKQVYNSLIDKGFSVWFVTSRPFALVDVTKIWLGQNGFDRGALVIAEMYKINVILELRPILIVDDDSLLALRVILGDIPALLVDQPWNRKSSVPRFSNLDKFDRELEAILSMRQK